ncbi:MAG: hypothetical protein CFH41_00910 [Alphaproteobacteria bacterium MarineAlpha11_Bin1]|nr:MAG: hypothetical protein CFH41_00910 [Alphaproteobacteria bacterium MarineAlpha11_Bin1]|tara:strand:- start:9408 stop:10499 length:1092 start_codon:yes stop_codon:yes gene_type:complete
MKKRPVSPFSLAFLDIMFCGFGAVVLLVVILNGEVIKKREGKFEDLRGVLNRATISEQLASEQLVETREELKTAQIEVRRLKSLINQRIKERNKADSARQISLSKLAKVNRDQSRLEREQAALRASTKLLKSKRPKNSKLGTRKLAFSGDGQRQYLTGLKLGGKRTLILVDSSASMLDETIVNIVRRKLMKPDQRRRAPKWQRTLSSVQWLLANLKPGTQFQIYSFSTRAKPIIGGSEGRWLSSDSRTDLQNTLNGIRAITPEGGTSLHRAFRVPKSFKPIPDSIILITDGLPTQDFMAKGMGQVSSDERVELFQSAVKSLPAMIPVNTLLFPIEGDPIAAVSFWELAIKTKGSFITPARDWP